MPDLTARPNDRSYSYQDFIRAYLAAGGSEGLRRDPDGYQSRLYEHLKIRFDVDFDPEFEKHSQDFGLLSLFQATVEGITFRTSPFAGYLEVSRSIIKMEQKYGRRLDKIIARLDAVRFELLCDIYRQVYGDTGLVVTSADLRATGYDDMPPDDDLGWPF